MGRRLQDALVMAAPVGLVLLFVTVGLAFILRSPVPRPLGWLWVVVIGINLVQFAIIGVQWYRSGPAAGEPDSQAFWGEILKRYFSLGAALYYWYCVRRPVRTVDVDSYKRSFWLPFARSHFTSLVRLINRWWVPILLVELLAGAIIGTLQWDVLVEPLFAAWGVTMILGISASAYFMTVVLRDAIVRWTAGGAERQVAWEIVSAFYGYRAAERYFRVVQDMESPRR